MNMLSDLTTPKEQSSHFPADLHTANLVAKDIISILRESIVEAVPFSLNTVRKATWYYTCSCLFFFSIVHVQENGEKGRVSIGNGAGKICHVYYIMGSLHAI